MRHLAAMSWDTFRQTVTEFQQQFSYTSVNFFKGPLVITEGWGKTDVDHPLWRWDGRNIVISIMPILPLYAYTDDIAS